MTPVTLTLPTNLLRRFREQAAEMLPTPLAPDIGCGDPDWEPTPEPFLLALRCAAWEAMEAHASLSPLEEPPATLVPSVTVYSAVSEAAADFVAQLAARSGITTAQAWHRVVLEFCEFRGPGVEVDVTEEVAA